ncbi:unnamed protein product [Paramecium sonneborni]|uniref:Transmembrane protein n=1 Tax=Paramecium sonneborni TaxID=65129 RepID=A0A8S1MAZ0_9CILI|nr:unnamed protein product [Paramecium sonneborni]
MKSQVTNYRQKSLSLQAPSSFLIRTEQNINKTLIAHHYNLPLISQQQNDRQDQNQKIKMFQHIQDFSNIKKGLEIIENYENQQNFRKVTDREEYRSLQENRQIVDYIKSQKQRYEDLIESNLDNLRNLEGMQFNLSTNLNEQSSFRKALLKKKILSFKPNKIHSINLNTIEDVEMQKNNQQIIFTQRFKQKLREGVKQQKTKNQGINLESSLKDSEEERCKTVNSRNKRPSLQLKIWNNINLNKQSQPKFQLRFRNKKFRIIVIVVFAILKLSKKYKKILEKRKIANKHFQAQEESHIKFINLFGIQQHSIQHRKFVDLLFQKIHRITKEQTYLQECQNIKSMRVEIRQDVQKQRLCFLIKILFQDLELITRKNIIPPFILHSLNLCLFSGKHTQTSQFVINRTKFYSKTVYSLNSQQKVLIALEYLIFTIIAPNILDIANELDQKIQDCSIITLFYFIAFTGVLMAIFTKQFEKLNKIQNSNIKPIQRVIQLKKNNQGFPCFAIFSVNNKIDENENKIIIGGFEYSAIIDLIQSKPFWTVQISKLFSKIVSNIGDLIDITNVQ